MAAQAAAAGMGLDLGTIVEQVAQEKGIDKKVLIETMEAAILKAAQAAFGPTRELEYGLHAPAARAGLGRREESIGQDHRDLAMTCGDQGRFANAANILSQHARFLLEHDEARKIITDLTEQVASTWYDTVRACSVSVQDAETIRSAFVYPGFSRE